jgi:hypothetical protein
MAQDPSEKQEQGTIRIVDRRRFVLDEEGKIIERTDLPPKASPPPPPPPPSSPSPSSPQATKAEGPRVKEKEDTAISQIFIEFLNSMAHSVLVHLGEIPEPGSNLIRENLEGAQQALLFLEVIRYKVEGNLTSQEARVFDTLLYELKVRFRQKMEKLNPLSGKGNPKQGKRV